MAFPPAHLLVGAGAAELVRAGAPTLPRWRAWALSAALAVVPDFDLGVGIAAGRASAYHGTFTHSVLATVVVGLLAWMVLDRRWAAVAVAGYGSHLLVDLLDARGQTNVLLGWPFTGERATAIGRLFPTVPFEQGSGVTAAFLSLFEPPVLVRLAEQTAVGTAIFAGMLGVAWAVRRLRSRSQRRVRRAS